MKGPHPQSPLRFPWWEAVIGLAAIACTFIILQFSTGAICCGDLDGYYHIHWSQLLWEGLKHGHLPEFSWLPLTSLNAHDYADQHFLFHLLLIPLLWFTRPVSAAKIAATLFGTLAVFACFWLLLRYRMRYRLVWLLALLGSSSVFLYRMNMARAQSLSLIFIMIGTVFLFEERYRWLAALGFVYAWTYNLFVILAAMAVLWMISLWWSEGRREWRPVAWTLTGVVAGLVVNPYFPMDIRLLAEHVTAKADLLRIASGTGMEWYALSSWQLLTSSLVAFAAMLAGYIAFGFLLGRGEKRNVKRPVFFLLFSTLLLVMAVRSKRFAEYWPPSAVLFAAFTLQHVLTLPPSERGVVPVVKPRSAWLGVKPAQIGTVLLPVLLTIFVVYQARQASGWMKASPTPDQYRAGARWIADHVPKGEIVFNASWDDFPGLFYYDDSHAYVSGLDPVYLADHNQSLGPLYDRIAAGKERHPGQAIHESFGANYVFVSPAADRRFYVATALSGEFIKVYEDGDCAILKVRNLPGTE